MLEDGHKQEDIDKMLKTNEEKSLHILEKGIFRFLNNNPETQILPWCIERWRSYTNQRKKYRQVL